jgi:hypothetical protein
LESSRLSESSKLLESAGLLESSNNSRRVVGNTPRQNLEYLEDNLRSGPNPGKHCFKI